MMSEDLPEFPEEWIYDLGFDSLKARLGELGMPGFTADQIFHWLYVRRETSIPLWSNIRLDHRRLLANTLDTSLPRILKESSDEGGTRKILLRLHDGKKIEAVLIPEKGHFTFCISSQVGCPLGCAFCATGKMGFSRNLSPGEIVAQVLLLIRMLPDAESRYNIVFMGMGEPLLNLENVAAALDVLIGKRAMKIAPRRVTLSTVADLKRLAEFERRFPGVKLSISLHAADDAIRSGLMPAVPRQSIAELAAYFSRPRRHPVTFEYVMIRGVNDSQVLARNLVRLVGGFRCKVNLILVNPVAGSGFSPPTPVEEEAFLSILRRGGIPVTVRRSKGRSIRSACGQLAADAEQSEQ